MPATRAPDPFAPYVTRFCGDIVPGRLPMLMLIRPALESQPLDCFNNARRQVDRFGGRIQFGWSVWEWPRVYVEAEHHAVYAPPVDKAWVDVTPANDGDTSRVFLPDDAAVYDFDHPGVRRENHRMALIDDPLVERLFDAAIEQNRIMNSIPGVGVVSVPQFVADRLNHITRLKAYLAHQIGMKHSQRNDRCFCGSGRKFKQCHGANR